MLRCHAIIDGKHNTSCVFADEEQRHVIPGIQIANHPPAAMDENKQRLIFSRDLQRYKRRGISPAQVPGMLKWLISSTFSNKPPMLLRSGKLLWKLVRACWEESSSNGCSPRSFCPLRKIRTCSSKTPPCNDFNGANPIHFIWIKQFTNPRQAKEWSGHGRIVAQWRLNINRRRDPPPVDVFLA